MGFERLVFHWLIASHYEDLDYFLGASDWEGVHSTRPLVRLVRLVRIEYHSFHCYSIGEMHIINALMHIGT